MFFCETNNLKMEKKGGNKYFPEKYYEEARENLKQGALVAERRDNPQEVEAGVGVVEAKSSSMLELVGTIGDVLKRILKQF